MTEEFVLEELKKNKVFGDSDSDQAPEDDENEEEITLQKTQFQILKEEIEEKKKLTETKLTDEMTTKMDEQTKEFQSKVSLLQQQIKDYFTTLDLQKNIVEGNKMSNNQGAGGGGYSDFETSKEWKDIKQRMLSTEGDITTLRQIAKNTEILQQELVQVRSESIVSYKMMQNLQRQQEKFSEEFKVQKMVEINQESQAYK